ncbi:MAG: carboxypeptidase regulatory-like domain-containing protein [Proteobacteria bacterium]|nr:MAG: carboxypeptidase regulatory-like domain-containing protein [Pseudomonadota bacterium]
MVLRSAFALVLAGSLGCSDHAYRHEIAGRVTDGAAPVAGALVQRVNDKGEPYGNDDAYRRVTDADGRFSFVAEGRGPSPMAYAPWTLHVTHEKHAERTLEVRATWSDDRATCFGYCAKDLAVDMK